FKAMQEGRWANRAVQDRLKGVSEIEPKAPAFAKIAWTDKDRIEKAVLGLDDLVPRMFKMFPDNDLKTTDVKAEIRKLRLKTKNIVGTPELLEQLRRLYNKLPTKAER